MTSPTLSVVPFRSKRFITHTIAVVMTVMFSVAVQRADAAGQRVQLTIETSLTYANTPMDPVIDFPELIRQARSNGVVDLNSIELRITGQETLLPFALSEEFSYSDKGRLEFVAADPENRSFELRFETIPKRQPFQATTYTPQIGVGDLLRYNAGDIRPVAVPYAPGLYDLDRDGQLDLTGTWNYGHRAGFPWDGIIAYPGAREPKTSFGEMARIRTIPDGGSKPEFLSQTYMGVDFADFNNDGLIDLVTTINRTKTAEFFLNTGDTEVSGMPVFRAAGLIPVKGWQACRAVDLDKDGATDVVVDGLYIRNKNPDGWPFQAEKPQTLDAGRKPAFIDMNGDGHLDSICLHGGDTVQPDFYQIAWRRNTGLGKLTFDAEEILSEIKLPDVTLAASWHHNGKAGLIVQYNAFQELAIYELQPKQSDKKRGMLKRLPDAGSMSAVMSLSDQGWPCLCDWDNDGDQDLLVGGGYGWPRIVINDGTRERPAFHRPMKILSEGRPIRFLRNQILGDPKNSHDMGYPFPVFIDWDNDGLNDLICPNETNRILWFKNIGTKEAPSFGAQQQIICDGYSDSVQQRSLSNQRANDPKSNNGVYPTEKERPFMWRTGTAFADFNGDGLTDFITHDGHTRKATLFAQYRHKDGRLGLRKDRVLALSDGRLIDDAIVQRRSHWTESFRPVDWNADGLQDLIYSIAGAHGGAKDGGSIYLLLNVGTKTDPVFAPPETMRCYGKPIRVTNHGPHPWCGDFDGDGKPDLIACTEWSVYPFYSHAALMMPERPQCTIRLLK